MAEEKELEGMKREMGLIADCLDELGDDLDASAVAEILRGLAEGETAESIIAAYGLTEAGV